MNIRLSLIALCTSCFILCDNNAHCSNICDPTPKGECQAKCGTTKCSNDQIVYEDVCGTPELQTVLQTQIVSNFILWLNDKPRDKMFLPYEAGCLNICNGEKFDQDTINFFARHLLDYFKGGAILNPINKWIESNSKTFKVKLTAERKDSLARRLADHTYNEFSRDETLKRYLTISQTAGNKALSTLKQYVEKALQEDIGLYNKALKGDIKIDPPQD